MSTARLKSPSAFEVALIVAIFAGWFIIGSVSAVMAGFPAPTLSDGSALGLIALEGVTFFVAATVLWTRGWRTKDFQFRATGWLSAVGVLLFAVAILFDATVFQILGSLVGGADFLEEFGRSISLTVPMALLLSIVNGAFEEFFLTRYMIEALANHGAPIALGASSLVRVIYHLYQGPTGAVAVLLFGIVITLFYWRYRQVWPVMIAHMCVDFVAFI